MTELELFGSERRCQTMLLCGRRSNFTLSNIVRQRLLLLYVRVDACGFFASILQPSDELHFLKGKHELLS